MGVPTVGILHQSVAVAVHGDELFGPRPESAVTRFEPGQIGAAVHVIRGGYQERRITVQVRGIFRGLAADIERHVTRQTIARQPLQIAIERLANEIQGG